MTNTSLRERFRMGEKQTSQISRLIKDATDAGKIKLKDTKMGKKFAIYIPNGAKFYLTGKPQL